MPRPSRRKGSGHPEECGGVSTYCRPRGNLQPAGSGHRGCRGQSRVGKRPHLPAGRDSSGVGSTAACGPKDAGGLWDGAPTPTRTSIGHVGLHTDGQTDRRCGLVSPHGPCLPEGRWKPCRAPGLPLPQHGSASGRCRRRGGPGRGHPGRRHWCTPARSPWSLSWGLLVSRGQPPPCEGLQDLRREVGARCEGRKWGPGVRGSLGPGMRGGWGQTEGWSWSGG